MKVTRRQAIALAGATAASAVAARRFRSKGAGGGDPVRIGVFGAGERGKYLLGRLGGITTARCVAVCDSDAAALATTASLYSPPAQSVSDYRAILERKDVEAVLIATPPHLHFSMARDALLAGKHAFCENVLAFRPSDVPALRALSDAHPALVLQVGLQRRYSQFYQIARQMVSKGMLGEVTHIQTQWHSNPGWALKPDVPREKNWRLFREFSGGLTAELLSHQIDVANWMFDDTPEFVTGVGGLDWRKDGRDVYDSVSLIFRYPWGRMLNCTALSTNRHLGLFGGTRKGAAELIMGTDGTIEITFGNEQSSPLALWFIEPGQKLERAGNRPEPGFTASATIAGRRHDSSGYPLLLSRDQIRNEDSFLEREAKYARRWLYSKGIAVPEEERNPIDVELESFFECCRNGGSPKAGIDAGLNVSTAVLLANAAMDEGRRVRFDEAPGPTLAALSGESPPVYSRGPLPPRARSGGKRLPTRGAPAYCGG